VNLLVVTVSAPFGPAEAFAAAELSSLRALGHRVTIAPVRPRGHIVHREFDAATDAILVAPLVSPAVLAGAIGEVIRAPRRVARLMVVLARSRSIQVLAKNLAVLPKALWLAGQARRLQIDHVHAYWASTPATVGLVASAAAGGAGFSFSAHAGDIDEDNLLRLKSQRASSVRVISHDGERRVIEAGVAPGALRLVRLGVEVPGEAAPRPRIQGRLSVLVPAALEPKKGHIDLLEALRELRSSSPAIDAHLDLAGAGPLEQELRRQVHDLGLADRVTFLGQLPHKTLLARYGEGLVDVVALASVTKDGREAEGIPVSLIEAMAHGIPVVATSSGGIPELVDETTGILVAMRDPGALAAAFRSLSVDPGHGDRLGAAGRARVRAEYDVRQTGADLVATMNPGPVAPT
jgi:colanic acid/amylovoran biosynthesis glycosyltransferase